jgi:hypothetical protein
MSSLRSVDIRYVCDRNSAQVRVWQDNTQSNVGWAGTRQETLDDLITNREQGQINRMSQRFGSEKAASDAIEVSYEAMLMLDAIMMSHCP